MSSNVIKRGLQLGLLLSICLFTSANAANLPSKIENALTNARIQPLNPSLPAPHFELPTLAGGSVSLNDAKGRWVLLTFFATWCGPCKSEMPSLQKFHENHSQEGFDVIGISTDSSIGIVKPFARQFRLTFPIGVDTEGKAASLYQASSIPVSFVIAPNGHIVGVARGARDWSVLQSTVASLVNTITPGSEVSSTFAANATPIELPTVLNPPTATYALSRSSIAPNQRFALDIIISWAGHFEDYLLHPPSISLPKDIVQHAMTANTATRSGRKTVTYRFDLEAQAEGSFAIDPIELRYTPRMEQQPIASRIAGPTITVAPKLIYGLKRSTFALLLISTLGIGFIGYLVFRPRSTPKNTQVSPADAYRASNDLFQQAKQARHQGDIASFLEILATLHAKFPTDHQPMPDYQAMVSQIRYGGHVPATPLLDQLQRTVELKLTQLRPDSDATDRKLLAETQQKGVTS